MNVLYYLPHKYICEQLFSASSCPIVTKPGQSDLGHWGRVDEILESQGQGRWGRYALYWAILVVLWYSKSAEFCLGLRTCFRQACISIATT